MENTEVGFFDNGNWLPEGVRSEYVRLGGAQFLFDKVSSGLSLIDIEKQYGIPSSAVMVFTRISPGFARAMDEAMEMRALHTSERIQSIANTFDEMLDASDLALDENDLERVALLHEVHENKRKLLKDKASILQYIDIKNRADKAAVKVVGSFDDVIGEISDIKGIE